MEKERTGEDLFLIVLGFVIDMLKNAQTSKQDMREMQKKDLYPLIEFVLKNQVFNATEASALCVEAIANAVNACAIIADLQATIDENNKHIGALKNVRDLVDFNAPYAPLDQLDTKPGRVEDSKKTKMDTDE
jgi:hypothetical protein